jgi:hypothetical protein
MSHDMSSWSLLSAIRSALTWSGDSSRATCTGTSDRPSCSAALSRVCPAMMTPSPSTTIGTRKPNSRMLLATASIAASLMVRG